MTEEIMEFLSQSDTDEIMDYVSMLLTQIDDLEEENRNLKNKVNDYANAINNLADNLMEVSGDTIE